MFLYPIPNRLALALFSVLLMTSCIKTSSLLNIPNPPSDTTGNGQPAITSAGTPIGSPSTAAIGSSGGSLNSPDGKFTLTVPAGALTSSISISIQPITNEAPGGVDTGYELLPSGTTFNTPVTLTYHYTDDVINNYGTSPLFLYIATQDSLGEWLVNLREASVDTIAKTVTTTTPHFSSYVPVSSLHLEYGQTVFRENESNFIKVMRTIVTSKAGLAISSPDDDLTQDQLPPLPTTVKIKTQVPDNEVSHWSLNGQGTTTIYGNIIGSGAYVTFQAPANIDQEQTVQVSVQLNGKYVASVKNKPVIMNQVTVFGSVKLHPKKYSYDVKLDFEATGTNPCHDFEDHYSQLSTFHVDIDGDSVTVSNVVNNPPSTTPTSGTDDLSGEACSYNASTIGAMNLLESGATGVVSPPANVAAPGVDRTAVVTVPQGNTIWPPSWTITEPFGGGSSLWGGVSLPEIPLPIRITVNDQTQTYPSSQGVSASGSTVTIYITITPTN